MLLLFLNCDLGKAIAKNFFVVQSLHTCLCWEQLVVRYGAEVLFATNKGYGHIMVTKYVKNWKYLH